MPAIGFVLGAIYGIRDLILAFNWFPDVAAAGYGVLFALEIFVDVGLLVFLIYAATRFFGRKRNAPSAIIALLIVSLVASGLILVIELVAGAEEFAGWSGPILWQKSFPPPFGFHTSGYRSV